MIPGVQPHLQRCTPDRLGNDLAHDAGLERSASVKQPASIDLAQVLLRRAERTVQALVGTP